MQELYIYCSDQRSGVATSGSIIDCQAHPEQPTLLATGYLSQLKMIKKMN